MATVTAAIAPPLRAQGSRFSRNKRYDGRTALGRRIKELLRGYLARIGDAASDPTVYADACRLCEVQAISEDRRAALIRHEPVDLAGLNRLENTRRRLAMALGVAGPPPPPKPMSLEQYAALLNARDAEKKAAAKATT
jgi:hypothetical protein